MMVDDGAVDHKGGISDDHDNGGDGVIRLEW